MQNRGGLIPALALLVITLITSGGAFYSTKRSAEANAIAEFERQADEVKAKIEARMVGYQQVLFGYKGLFEASQFVSYDEFHSYANALNVFEDYPGILTMGFLRYVRAKEIPALEAEVREVVPSYAVRPPLKSAKPTDIRTPIVYLTPMNEAATTVLGYDPYSDGSRRDVFVDALRLNQPLASRRITLQQDVARQTGVPGIIMTVPVFKAGADVSTPAARQANIYGYMTSAFRMPNLLEGILGGSPYLTYELYDGEVNEANLLHASKAAAATGWVTSREVDVGGRQWILRANPTDQLLLKTSSDLPVLVLVSGIAISFLLFGLILAVTMSRNAARYKEHQFRTITENNADLTLVLDSKMQITFCSQSAQRLLGYDVNELLGRNLLDLLHVDHQPDFSDAVVLANEMPNKASPLPSIKLLMTTGAWVDVDGMVTSTQELHGLGVVVVNFRDVSALREMETKLRELALHDVLTGIANRALFQRHLSMLAENKTSAALIAIDLDDFKIINDSLGHAAGDDVLRVVANRMRHSVRRDDVVSRTGGDEFVLLLRKIGDSSAVRNITAKVLESVRRPINIGGEDVIVGASAGIAYIENGEEAEEALKQADVALYHAKRTGKYRYVEYHDELEVSDAVRRDLIDGLRRGIQEDEFELYYQPKVCLKTGACIGLEALVRWCRDDDIIAPKAFIQLCEQSGLIIELGALVMDMACAKISKLSAAGIHIPVSVNISVQQVENGSLLDVVQRSLSKFGTDPKLLELELTESLLIDDSEHTAAVLHDLKALGLTISIDDFGSGYSGFSYLRSLPIDVLKIDASFVADLPQDQQASEIVEAIISMAAAMKLKVVAEGIEQAAQRDLLLQLGCDYGQGYYFGRPMPEHQVIEALGEFELVTNSN